MFENYYEYKELPPSYRIISIVLDVFRSIWRKALNGHSRAIASEKVHAEATPRETQGGKKRQDRFCDDR